MTGALAFMCMLVLGALLKYLLHRHASVTAMRRLTKSNASVVWSPNLRINRPVSRDRYERQLPAALDALTRSLYSGAGFSQALREASELNESAVCADIARVVHQMDLGVSADQALADWAERVDYECVRLTVASMGLALTVGANQAESMDAAGAAVRRSVEAMEIARTYSTDARYSAIAIAVMPLFVSFPLITLNSGSRHFMLATVWGWCALIIGVGLDTLGGFWIRALMKRSLR